MLGFRVHYIDEGTGPVLLMLHGIPSWSFIYREIIKGLRDQFRCIALDYPGFGLSRAPEGYGFTPEEHAEIVATFLKALNLPPVTMMVHDWGGPIGFSVAGRYPERVRALIIGNTFAWPLNGSPLFERFSIPMGGRIGRFFIENFNAARNLLLPGEAKRRKLAKEVMAAYRGPFLEKAAKQRIQLIERALLHSHDFVAEVKGGLVHLKEHPALILWGDHDPALRAPELKRIQSLFPKHQTVILRGAGHNIQEDAADDIIQAAVAWWWV